MAELTKIADNQTSYDWLADRAGSYRQLTGNAQQSVMNFNYFGITQDDQMHTLRYCAPSILFTIALLLVLPVASELA
jgi:hypothetical protein